MWLPAAQIANHFRNLISHPNAAFKTSTRDSSDPDPTSSGIDLYSEGACGLESLTFEDSAPETAQLDAVAMTEILVDYQEDHAIPEEEPEGKAKDMEVLAGLQHFSSTWELPSGADENAYAEIISEGVSRSLHMKISHKHVVETMSAAKDEGATL